MPRKRKNVKAQKNRPTIGVGGVLMKHKRERLGWSLGDLEHFSGLPKESLYKLEMGYRSTMRRATALVLSRIFSEHGEPTTADQLRGDAK
jgi:predicted transcriptional regulator